jgi:hypothetical protein
MEVICTTESMFVSIPPGVRVRVRVRVSFRFRFRFSVSVSPRTWRIHGPTVACWGWVGVPQVEGVDIFDQQAVGQVLPASGEDRRG